MKLVDSNVWLAMSISTHVFHKAATDWFSAETRAGELAFCRATQQSYLRLLTTRGVFAAQSVSVLTNAEAWDLYYRIAADPRICFSPEPAGIEGAWKSFSARSTSSPKLWMDAYLAAFAVAGSYELVSTDDGFKQYVGLKLKLLTVT